MLSRTEGIVLRTHPYGEADLLVTYLTLDFGLKKAFAKSPRKIKSRFGSSLEPFTHSKIAFMGREDAALPRLTQSDIIKSFQPLREDFNCMLMLSGMAELTLNFLHADVKSPKSFLLLKRVLEMMEDGCGSLYPLLYKIRFLSLKGYLPGLGGCGKCGKAAQNFYASHGSVMCPACAVDARHTDPLTISQGSIKLFEALSTWDMERTRRLKASDAMVKELTGVLTAHIEYMLAKPLKSASFAG